MRCSASLTRNVQRRRSLPSRCGNCHEGEFALYKTSVHGREVLERVVEAFGDGVFHTVISRTVRFPETTVAGEPITTYAPSSTGAVGYRQLAKEVLARCHVE